MILSGGLFYYACAGFFAGIALLAKGVPTFRLKRLIENTPTSKVRSAAVGLVEVCGEVVFCEEKLKSPFTGKDCVYHMCTVENFMGGSRARWFQVLYDEKRVPFYAKDDTGKILVDPKDASVQISLKWEIVSGQGEDPPASIVEYLKTNNLSHKGFPGNKTMRFREYIISEGDMVYVMGRAEPGPDCREKDLEKGADCLILHNGTDNKVFNIYPTSRKERSSKSCRTNWTGAPTEGRCYAACVWHMSY